MKGMLHKDAIAQDRSQHPFVVKAAGRRAQQSTRGESINCGSDTSKTWPLGRPFQHSMPSKVTKLRKEMRGITVQETERATSPLKVNGEAQCKASASAAR